MDQHVTVAPRVARATEAATVAELLDAFNREFDTPTPGAAVLATRLERLLAGGQVIALLAGDPAVAVALLTLRPSVWYDGPVALLDELYVAPDLRGRGIGSVLLASAESVTRQRGGELLEIIGHVRRPTHGSQSGESAMLADAAMAAPNCRRLPAGRIGVTHRSFGRTRPTRKAESDRDPQVILAH